MDHPSQAFRSITLPLLSIGLIPWTLARIPSCAVELTTRGKIQSISQAQPLRNSRPRTLLVLLVLNGIILTYRAIPNTHLPPLPHALATTAFSTGPPFAPMRTPEQRAHYPSSHPTVLSFLRISDRQPQHVQRARSATRPSVASPIWSATPRSTRLTPRSSSVNSLGARTATIAKTSLASMLDVVTLLRERLEQRALNTPVSECRWRVWSIAEKGSSGYRACSIF